MFSHFRLDNFLTKLRTSLEGNFKPLPVYFSDYTGMAAYFYVMSNDYETSPHFWEMISYSGGISPPFGR